MFLIRAQAHSRKSDDMVVPSLSTFQMQRTLLATKAGDSFTFWQYVNRRVDGVLVTQRVLTSYVAHRCHVRTEIVTDERVYDVYDKGVYQPLRDLLNANTTETWRKLFSYLTAMQCCSIALGSITGNRLMCTFARPRTQAAQAQCELRLVTQSHANRIRDWSRLVACLLP